MEDSTELIRQLTRLYGPPGQEGEVSEWLAETLAEMGYDSKRDSKGSVLVEIPGDPTSPCILVTAHLDEIALMITKVEDGGKIRVMALGGSYPWKWGEGEMDILASGGCVPAILSFGSIHTNHSASVVEQARHKPLGWDQAYLFTGLNSEQLAQAKVRPGLRVVLAKSRREIKSLGDFLCGYFLDDRADLAVWLMTLETLKKNPVAGLPSLVFAATSSEEIGGLGAKFILRDHPADICIALEIGPKTPEADFEIDSSPTIWVRDGYAPMEAIDGEILEACCRDLQMKPHWQLLSRGGSDSSCAAEAGLVSRPVTLGLPVENSHGFEIMHRDAPREMTRLLLAYLIKLSERKNPE